MFGLFGMKRVSDQFLTWGDPQLVTSIRRRRFERCEITITCPARGIIICKCVLNDCTIKVRRPFSDYQFFHVGFDGCRFVGKFPGCEFGYRRSANPGRGMQGYVRNCDFSQATLDLVRFNGTDVSGLRLPPWPHFLARSPAAFAEVAEFAEDPEWSLHGQTPWPPETTGLVVLYRSGGPRGFKLPPEQALPALQRYPSFAVTVPA